MNKIFVLRNGQATPTEYADVQEGDLFIVNMFDDAWAGVCKCEEKTYKQYSTGRWRHEIIGAYEDGTCQIFEEMLGEK